VTPFSGELCRSLPSTPEKNTISPSTFWGRNAEITSHNVPADDNLEHAMAQWYSGRDGQQYGPFEEAQMMSMVADGRVLSSDLVWREGLAQWVPASSVPELFPSGANPLTQQQTFRAQTLGYGGGTYSAAESFRGQAQTAMILSLVGLICVGIICGPLAIVFASQALSGMKRSGNEDGKGMAIAGLVIGIIEVVLNLLSILVFVGRL
jgi:hypothetical protein